MHCVGIILRDENAKLGHEVTLSSSTRIWLNKKTARRYIYAETCQFSRIAWRFTSIARFQATFCCSGVTCWLGARKTTSAHKAQGLPCLDTGSDLAILDIHASILEQRKSRTQNTSASSSRSPSHVLVQGFLVSRDCPITKA